MESALAVIGWAMVAATIVPFARADIWWVRIFDFPRIQITALFIATLALYVYLREEPNALDNGFLAILSACVGYQLWRMRPYTRLARKQVPDARSTAPERTLSLLVCNVLMSNRNAGPLLALLRRCRPDVIFLVETDEWWLSQLAPLRADYPFTIERPQDNTYGMVLFSRLQLEDAQIRHLVQPHVPSVHTLVRLTADTTIELYGLHPRPPGPNKSERSTPRDAELMVAAKELQNRDVLALTIGDLNDVAWSRTNNRFQAISRLRDPRVGRGFYCTFHAKWPLLRFPLDHVFCSRHFELLKFSRLDPIGSDHFPVFIELSLGPGESAGALPPTATAEDERRASRKIRTATYRGASRS